MVISSLLIPTTPVAWAFVTAPWQVILINLVGGGLWAAFNLASFNYLLTQMPDETRPRLSAVYQVVQLASLAAGAALGGQLVAHWGYAAVFLISASGRVIAGLLFSRLAPEEQRRKQQPPAGNHHGQPAAVTTLKLCSRILLVRKRSRRW